MWRRRRRRTDEDFREEVLAHLELEAERLAADGMRAEGARAAAHRAFGNPLRTRERFYESRRAMAFEHFLLDCRYAWRGLWKSRAVAASLVLTLGVALSLLTTFFALVNAYVLRPFAVDDPYALVSIGWLAQETGESRTAESSGRSFRWVDYEEIRPRADLFDAVVAEDVRLVSSESRMLAVGFVSGDYFTALRPRVQLGRLLSPGDVDPVTVLTHRGWERLFGRDPGVLGRQLRLNDQMFTVVGVARREFSGLDGAPRDAWVPVPTYRAVVGEDPFPPSGPRVFNIVARLRRDVTGAQVQSSLALAPFDAIVPGRPVTVRATVTAHATPVSLSVETVALLSPVFAAFGLVLLTASANASNVMLARAHARHREIGVRLAIGASRSRIVRQLLTEALLISLSAGVLGLVLASLAVRAVPDLIAAVLPVSIVALFRFAPLDLDWRVFLFALGCAGMTTILFALLPALQSTRLTLTHALRGEVSGTVQSARLRAVLVATQVAVSLALVVCALTLVRNVHQMAAVELGFRTANVISVNTRGDVPGAAAAAAKALGEDPRVESVASASRNPLFGSGPPALHEPSTGAMPVPLSITYVTPGYFDLLEIPLLHGRGFLPGEARREAAVAIVSANAAARLWPGADPVGQTLWVVMPPEFEPDAARIRLDRARGSAAPSTALTIVGVAQDVVGEFVYLGKDPARIYLPTHVDSPRAEALLVRTRPSPDPVQPALDQILRRVHADPLTFESIPLADMLAIQLFPLKMASWTGSLLGVIALLLSVSGLHSVLMYTFGQRVREIGIRMALGASPGAVVSLVMHQSARMAGAGALAGGLLMWIVFRVLASIIPTPNVTFVDVLAFAVSAGIIAAAVAAASYGPARRAARVDPAVTLRADG
jgi:predicted permease